MKRLDANSFTYHTPPLSPLPPPLPSFLPSPFFPFPSSPSVPPSFTPPFLSPSQLFKNFHHEKKGLQTKRASTEKRKKREKNEKNEKNEKKS